MKRSIAYLPKRKQDDIHYLVRSVLERMPQTEMIILYGSYATGKYVDRDERIEFGIRTAYMSDYDILVATHEIRNREAGQKLEAVENKYYTDPDSQTPVQFINEDIKKLNKDLSELNNRQRSILRRNLAGQLALFEMLNTRLPMKITNKLLFIFIKPARTYFRGYG